MTVRVVDRLSGFAGNWTGVNRFRLRPADATEPLRSTARLAVVAGHGITLAYTWVHPVDGPQEGFLLSWDAAHRGGAVGVWLDTWHQEPVPMDLSGMVDVAGVRLAGGYGPDSGWTIVIGAGNEVGLRVGMINRVGPDGEPYPAMAADYRRVGGVACSG